MADNSKLEEINKDLMKFIIKEDEKVVLYNDENEFEISLSIKTAKFFSPVLTAALETPLRLANHDVNISSNKTIVDSTRYTSAAVGNILSDDSADLVEGSIVTVEDDSDASPHTDSTVQLLMESTKVEPDEDHDTEKKFASCPRINVIGFDKTTVECFVGWLHGNGSFNNFSWYDLVKMLKISHFYGVESFLTLFKEKGEEMICPNNLAEAIGLINIYEIHEWLDTCSDVLQDNGIIFIKLDGWENLMVNHSKVMARVLSRYLEKRCKQISFGASRPSFLGSKSCKK